MKNFLNVAALVATMILAGCGGGGGSGATTPVTVAPPTTPTTQPPVTPPTPIVVAKSSYENKMAASAALGAVTLPTFSNEERLTAGYALADFFRDGTYSMVAFTMDSSSRDSNGYPTKPGKIHFFKKVGNTWVDSTAAVLADTTGCIAPRKIIVADFNGDSKPDVFAACHGYDAPPYSGEKQHFLLSQTNGTFKHEVTPFDCFCHGASAADTNNDGYASILIADQTVAKTPYVLVNNKGTFSQDFSKLSTQLKDKHLWTAELIDFNADGKYDAFLAGGDTNSTQSDYLVHQQNPTIYLNDGTKFSSSIELPGEPSYGMVLDVAAKDGNVYVLRTNIFNAANNYNAVEIQKVNLTTKQSNIIYTHSGKYDVSQDTHWFPWIGIFNNQIISTNLAYGVSVPM